jgi:hypothetical protein
MNNGLPGDLKNSQHFTEWLEWASYLLYPLPRVLGLTMGIRTIRHGCSVCRVPRFLIWIDNCTRLKISLQIEIHSCSVRCWQISPPPLTGFRAFGHRFRRKRDPIIYLTNIFRICEQSQVVYCTLFRLMLQVK